MSKQCQILGTRASTGNRVSHSHRKTRRRFNPNLQTKRYWVPSLGRHVTLTVSVKGMKTIDRIGIEAALARIRRNTPDRLELTKFDPVVRKRVTFREESVPTARTNHGRPSVISAHSHHQGASMAKTSKINKQLQREQIVAKYAQRRAQCKRDSVNPHLTADERAEAMRRLHAIPRDASPTRLRNRDSIDGRPRAFNRKFGLSRINLREKAHRGELPGVVKSSW